MTHLRNFLLTIAALSILPGAIARADSLSVTLEPSILSAQPGQTITFSGTITNLESFAVFLNACDVNIPGQFTSDCSPFYNLPLSLDPFETTALFDLFTVTVDQPYTDLSALQSGTFTVIGGVDGDAQDNLVQAEFSVDVVPEPSTAVLLGLALTLTFAVGCCGKRAEGKSKISFSCFAADVSCIDCLSQTVADRQFLRGDDILSSVSPPCHGRGSNTLSEPRP